MICPHWISYYKYVPFFQLLTVIEWAMNVDSLITVVSQIEKSKIWMWKANFEGTVCLLEKFKIRNSPFTFHFCISQFGSQLWFTNRHSLPIRWPSITGKKRHIYNRIFNENTSIISRRWVAAHHVHIIALPHVRCACGSACGKGIATLCAMCVRAADFLVCDVRLHFCTLFWAKGQDFLF